MNQAVMSRCSTLYPTTRPISLYTDLSWSALWAVNVRPPVADAIAVMAAGSAGTGTVSPWMLTVPFWVPKAMVLIFTPAALAAAASVATESVADIPFSPMVGDPSLINTMAPGAFCPALPSGTLVMAWTDSLMAAAVAVPPPAWRLLMAARTVARSEVGAARTLAVGREVNQTDLDAGGKGVDELAGGLLGCSQPGRRHVCGDHGTRSVEGEHDRGPLFGDRDQSGGLGEGEDKDDEGAKERAGRHVALPSGALRRHRSQRSTLEKRTAARRRLLWASR